VITRQETLKAHSQCNEGIALPPYAFAKRRYAPPR
jgi:hypothetical protein